MQQGPRSQALFSHAKNLIPGGVNSPVRAFRNVEGDPFFVRDGKGSHITDVDGKQYIDYVGTWGPAILGHAPAPVLEAVYEAASKGLSFGIPTEAEVDMAEMITQWIPSVEKVRLVNSGTEATMSCIRLARGYTGRSRIIKFIGCYHGHVDSLLVAAGSGALTFGEPDSAGVPRELALLTMALPYNDEDALKSAFETYGDDIAGVIVESYPANAGLYFPKPGFLKLLRDLTKKWGSLLIFDEVMTGFRIARGGVQEKEGLVPDLTAMGKVIGGGLPVGAFGGRRDIMDYLSPLGPVYQAGTLSGNPLAMAAGIAQLSQLESLNGFTVLESLGARLEAGIREVLQAAGCAYTFHRAGSMFCLFFTEDPVYDLASAQKADLQRFRRFFWKMLEQGIYFAPSPYETGFISLAHTPDDIDRTVEAVRNAFRVI